MSYNYIFDLDDTLFDNSDIVYETVGRFFRDFVSRRNKAPRSGNFYTKLKQSYSYYHYLKTREYLEKEVIDITPGAKKFLEENRSFNAGLTNAPYRSTKLKLRRLGLNELLDSTLTPLDAERKPKPDGIHSLIEESKKDRESFVYVGDSLKDLLAGKRAGVRTVLITSDFKKKALADEHYTTFQDFVDNH